MSAFINSVDTLGDALLVDSIITRSISEYKDDGVTTIAKSSFHSCSLLSLVDVPNVKSIQGDAYGSGAFEVCTALTTLILRNTEYVCTLSVKEAFNNTPIKSGTGYVYVPRALVDSYKSATNWSAYASQFRALEDWTADGTITGELDISRVKALLAKTIKGTYVNNRITSVGMYAFDTCTQLNGLDFALVTSIDASAFSGCSNLTTLILRSETVCTLAGTNAFTGTKIASGAGYVYVPSALVDSYKEATNWTTYATQIRAIEDYPDICGGDV